MKKFLLLTVSFLILSSSGVFLKLASMHDFLSCPYIAYFGLTILVMAVYAVLWQRVLEIMPLNRAYLYKSFGVGISMMYAYIIFHEHISINNILGCAVIISGIMVLSSREK